MKIAFLGYGIEAESAYKYFAKQYPDADFVVYENKPAAKNVLPNNIEFHGNIENFENIDADIVVRTPAVNPKNITTRGKVTSVTKLFFESCPAPIIGVTGTKGKGTTASLIAEILKTVGKKVWLVGNIGEPALNILDEVQPEDIVVYELSSFQLWDLEISPHVAVVLMVEPEHLDVHDSFEDYTKAKANITKYQNPSDIVVYLDRDSTSSQIAKVSSGKKIDYHVLDGENIEIDGQFICKKNEVGLLGHHNLENIYAAITAAWQFTKDIEAISKTIKSFTGLPHRLEFVREVNNIRFYDDSFSSAPPSTKVAIRSFEEPVILIAGGYDRGLDYSDLAEAINKQKNVKKVLLIGQTKGKISELLTNVPYELMNDFQSTVREAYKIAEPGDVVLLSPGCASFDMFKNFTERGDEFKNLVNKL